MTKIPTQKDKFLYHLREILENPENPDNVGVIPVKEAVRRAGYSQPDTQWWRVAKNHKDDIIELTKDLLVESGPEAAQTLIAVMRGSHGENGAARDKLSAALNVLDRGTGIVKVEKVEVEHKPGLIALPPKEAAETPED